ncbi:MAG: bifunctional YncE family protein/alkaline phosphatase family protein, partial [Candidatus Angelobacter sp.]
GIKPLGLNDALQPPMAEVFSTQQVAWTHKARVPSILRSTKLPLPAATPEDKAPAASLVPGHDAAYWADKTKAFDFTAEDKLDSQSFNMVLWTGLKGPGQPYPSERNGRDLRKHRSAILRDLRKSKN